MAEEDEVPAHRGGRPGPRALGGFLRTLFAPEIRAWEGRAPLARVFWVYGVLTSLGLGLLYALALEAGRRGLQQAMLAAFILYTGWILVAVWRCARNAPPGFRLISRMLTIAWAANTLLVAGFLQVDLLASYLGS